MDFKGRSTIVWRRPDPVVRVYWIVSAILPLTIIFTFFSMLLASMDGSPEAVVLCCGTWVVVLVISSVWAVLFYRSYLFRISSDGVEIKRGIMFRSERLIPYERIQHLTVTRGPLMSFFGISDINLYTAGTGSVGPSAATSGIFGAEGYIPGISDPDPLRRTIMLRIEESRSGSGLGDEVHDGRHTPSTEGDPMLAMLREVKAIRMLLSRKAGEEPEGELRVEREEELVETMGPEQ